MGNDKYIAIVNSNNLLDVIERNLLCAFKFENKKYIIYSNNEKDYDGNEIVYVGKVIDKEGKQYIKNLKNDEYNKVKDIIKKIINYSGDDNDV